MAGFGKINLAALKSMKMKTKKGTEGIFIPFKENNIFIGEKGGMYLDIILWKIKNPTNTQSHIVKMSVSKEKFEKMTDEEKKAIPIIGNLKIYENGNDSEVNNTAGAGKTFDEDSEDMPF